MAPWVSAFLGSVMARGKLGQIAFYRSLQHRLRIRNRFATALSGRGIELGAQQVPTELPAQCTVEYVDVISNEQLVSRYSLPADDLVPLTHVIDGNDLGVYSADELDFVIANHVLEHFDDPVGGVLEWMRIIRPGGRLFITLPNFRSNSFDFRREPARADHLALDHHDPEGRPARNFQHYEDFARTLYQWPEGDPRIKNKVDEWVADDMRHHYHVYDEKTVKAVFDLAAKEFGVGLHFVDGLISKDGFEFLLIIEKRGSGGLTGWPNSLLKLARAARAYSYGCKRDTNDYIMKRIQAK